MEENNCFYLIEEVEGERYWSKIPPNRSAGDPDYECKARITLDHTIVFTPFDILSTGVEDWEIIEVPIDMLRRLRSAISQTLIPECVISGEIVHQRMAELREQWDHQHKENGYTYPSSSDILHLGGGIKIQDTLKVTCRVRSTLLNPEENFDKKLVLLKLNHPNYSDYLYLFDGKYCRKFSLATIEEIFELLDLI